MWCRLRIYQLNKSWCRCWYKWDVIIDYLTRAIFEKQLTALHVRVRTFHHFNRYADRDQNCSFDLIYFQRSGVYTHWFFHIALYCYWLNAWGTSGGKAKSCFREWPFVYFSGGFISHLFGDYANINMWNQTMWRLEILLGTIVAALLKTKYNGRFVQNKRYQETGKEYFTIVQMIVKDDGY